MESLFPLAILIVGILVMFRVISVSGSGRFLLWIVLAAMFGPVAYRIAKANAIGFFSEKHPWWMYILAFFVVLIFVRGVLNFLFPGRRR